ncbi:TonB-dependent receptor [Roseateles toxinivorans]|uniref:Iron complex outermembrane receptor protein n=1 Tax=Roseateles toxinivorans TaxID=270368 RepID=A0A4R6QMX6_9BURK|nr:TonB-dependent receptor [Roseateles toxinivorans]TDP71242.1 iron complex outermembrane receptor protein [Roseateles toxinivorans]
MNTRIPATLHSVALACSLLALHTAHACEGCGDEDEVETPLLLAQSSAPSSTAPTRQLGLVIVTGAALTSLPTHIPTTIEGISADEIARHINATDAEDALKYLPSLLVRKRYIGDYNHAVLSTRASGTGNSARSLVYADGILLSNLLGNGAGFTPRWGLVTPEEIARVDVLYGPFSAAYAGNSVGAVVDYQTRMPKSFEAHAKLGVFHQPFDLYSTHQNYGGHQASASLGSRSGGLSWWVNVNRLDSEGHPLTFVTKPVSGTAAAAGTTIVSGGVAGLDKSNTPWVIIGAGTQYHTVQDHAKLKLAYDLSPTLRASYTVGLWRNGSEGQSSSYLRDANGQPFHAAAANSGTARPTPISLDGKAYTLAANDFGQGREALEHRMQGLSLKSQTRGVFDWELAASRYDYASDLARSPLLARPGADAGGAGRITDLSGTGWTTLAARGVWRPAQSAHQVELGAQQERYQWQQRVSDTGDWINGAPTALFTAFSGRTQLRSLYAQDAWQLDDKLKALIGGRLEQWQALAGSKTASNGTRVDYAARSESHFSPKAALGYQAAEDLTLKLSTGKAVRMPTAGELYQGGVSAAGVYVPGDPTTNPGLKPERGWTTEFAAIWTLGGQQLRTSLFHEDTRDALYSQSSVFEGKTVSSVQNIGRIATTGFELALQAGDLFVKGLELQASLTYADSKIKENSGFVAAPGDTQGRQQPRVPKWRASLLVSYPLTPALSASYGARYGSSQYGTLNNSDGNGFAYQGFSKFFSGDLRLRYRIDRQWSVAAGIDNLNNYKYWNFHPYPQRSYSAELSFDL